MAGKSRRQMAIEQAKELVPSPAVFLDQGDRIDKANNKTESLAAIAANCGDIQATLKSGVINYDALRRYLADPAYKERLIAIQAHLNGSLAAKGVEMALSGDGDMVKFMLSAGDHDYDAGIRREQARAKTAFGLEIFKQILNPAPQTTDNADYVTLEAPDWSDVIGFDPSPPDGPSLTEAPIRPVVSESDKGDTKV